MCGERVATPRKLNVLGSPARLTHQPRLVDKSTPTRRGGARPAGVHAAEVWVKLVDAHQPTPTDPSALSFLTLTTRPSFRAEFKPGDGEDGGLYEPLGQHAGRERPVVADHGGNGGGVNAPKANADPRGLPQQMRCPIL